MCFAQDCFVFALNFGQRFKCYIYSKISSKQRRLNVFVCAWHRWVSICVMSREQSTLNVRRSSLPFSFNCCLPLRLFRFLFDLTFIFQQRDVRVRERHSVWPIPCEWKSFVYSVYTDIRATAMCVCLLVYTSWVCVGVSVYMWVSVRAHCHNDISMLESVREKKLACAYGASLARTHSNQRWRSMILS